MEPVASAGLALPVLLAVMAAATGAGAQECGRGEFRCGDGACIARAWVCDGSAECRDGTDEAPESCHSIHCPPSEFSCGGRRPRCLPPSWRCDGHRDCDNGADELDCPPRSCAGDQLRCGAGGGCVSRAFVCDGERDCEDGADEAGCPPPPPCPPHAFRCNDSSCVSPLWACDGDRDCPDGSDEWPERCGAPRPPRRCPPLHFACGSGRCIPRRWRCDGSADCPDRSDEEGCEPPPTCRPDQFQCRDGRCVLGVRQCDGEPDCGDGSDEEGCHNVTACNDPHEFKCRSGECIPLERVCDERRDCRDWSDEPLKECGVDECLAGGGGCSHVCRDLRLGYECLCPGGFTLGPDGRTCQDIDECWDPRSCSQRCLNLPGSFKCECGGGYRLDPRSGACRALGPPAALLLSTRHELRRLALDGSSYRRLRGTPGHAAALAADLAAGTVYWADRSRGTIYRAALEGAGDGDGDGDGDVTVVASGLGSPEGLALDWVHHNLYWTDAGAGTVAVVGAGGGGSRTLVREAGAKPRGIAVDPLGGYMYWTDWGVNAKIAKGGLNGADQFALVTEGVEWPNGITLDQSSQRLYWVDSRLHTISAVDLDGGRRSTLLADPRTLAHPFAVAVFEDTLFWSDPQLGSLLAGGLRGGPPPRRLLPELPEPGALLLLHPLRQPPGDSRCPVGVCGSLCLPAPQLGPHPPRYSCACPDGQRLAPDGRACLTGTPRPPRHLPAPSPPPLGPPRDPLTHLQVAPDHPGIALHPHAHPDPPPHPDPTPAPSDAASDTPTTTPTTPNPSWDPRSQGGTLGPPPNSTDGTGSTGIPGNGTAAGRPGDAAGRRTGLTALAILLPLALLLLLLGARGLWRGWRRRSTNSISFVNPLFQKPPPEEQPLGDGGGPVLQPLTLDDDVA